MTYPDSSYLIKQIDLKTPLIGFFDAPGIEEFEPLVRPQAGACVYSFYQDWLKGSTLLLTKSQYGCGGCGHWLFGIQARSRDEFLSFLVDQEGLKCSRELMAQWIESSSAYEAENPYLLLGPLKQENYAYVKSITFFINPDQLSTLSYGAQYYSAPDDPPPVIAPFGSGCSQLFPFDNPDIPQAAIGATDLAMRQHVPPQILAFTVTKSMFEQLCSLDEQSFLGKPFLQRVKEARSGKLDF